MSQRSRKSRVHSLQRTLSIEALEERTLLTVSNGIVLAGLNPFTGLLTVQGDAGNNSVVIAPSSTPGNISVSGVPFTSVNSVRSVNFPLAAATGSGVNFLNGNNNLSVAGLNLPGNLAVNAGTGVNTFSVANSSANSVTFNTGNGGNAINLNSVKTGAVAITTGTGPSTDSINLNGVTVGTAAINSGAANANIGISGQTIGNLSVNAGAPGQAGAPAVSVNNSVIGKANINVTGVAPAGSASTVNLSNLTITSNAANAAGNVGGVAPSSLNVQVGSGTPGVPTSYNVTLSNLVFNTGSPSVLNNGSASIHLGNAAVPSDVTPPSTLNVSGLSGANNLSISAGQNVDTVALNSIAVNSLHTTVGNNNTNFSLTNANVAGPVHLSFGANAGNVSVTNVTTAVTPLDLALGRPADMTLNFGANPGSVALNGLNVGRNLSVGSGGSSGDGGLMLAATNVTVGQDLNLNTTSGNNPVLLGTVNVANQLSVGLGTAGGSSLGNNTVVASNVTSAFGSITGGATGSSNVFWNVGGNSGFFVNNFGNFITGPATA
jgi:hypothetical protein